MPPRGPPPRSAAARRAGARRPSVVRASQRDPRTPRRALPPSGKRCGSLRRDARSSHGRTRASTAARGTGAGARGRRGEAATHRARGTTRAVRGHDGTPRPCSRTGGARGRGDRRTTRSARRRLGEARWWQARRILRRGGSGRVVSAPRCRFKRDRRRVRPASAQPRPGDGTDRRHR